MIIATTMHGKLAQNLLEKTKSPEEAETLGRY